LRRFKKIKEERKRYMSTSTQALAQLRKATSLTNRTFHKCGPKSYKNGQGALLKVLHKNGGSADTRKLIDTLGFDRKTLKAVVRKAERNGYATIKDADQPKTYVVELTETGSQIAEKRCAAQTKTADAIMEALTEEEITQLNALTEKLILSCKTQGAHGKFKGGRKQAVA
jgi:DNA-binding MarR family transcriptional regulator